MPNAKFPTIEYENHKKFNPFWSDFSCFVATIKGKKQISTRNIRKYFNELVDKNDYAQEDKNEIIKYLLEVRDSIE